MNINLMILTALSYKYGLIAECFEKSWTSDNMNVEGSRRRNVCGYLKTCWNFSMSIKGNAGTLLKGPNEAYPEVRFYGHQANKC